MNVSNPGSAASGFVVEFEVLEERGRKGLRVRREVSISFLICFGWARVPFCTRMSGSEVEACLELGVYDN
jgi:hypothetical protein